MKLKQGQKAPNFEMSDIHGTKINLHKLSNQKVLLTFFRYAECAMCNLRISEIKKESEKFKPMFLVLPHNTLIDFRGTNERIEKYFKLLLVEHN